MKQTLILSLMATLIHVGTAFADPSDITGSLKPSSSQPSISSIVLVSPSGRLRSRGVSFSLPGIALPRNAVCRDRTGRRWGCGTTAFVKWSHLFASAGLRCTVGVKPDTGVSSCQIDGQDVAKRLVQSGWGIIDAAHASPDLIDAEQVAKHNKVGIWSADQES